MNIAHIVPRNHLELAALGDFDFVLAHIALKDQTYLEHFTSCNRNRPAERIVYLDNGVWETGDPVDPRIMIDLAIDMDADYVYATDYIDDSAKTIESVAKFCALARANPNFGSKIVATSQGRTRNDWLYCIRKLSEIQGVDVVALPRHIKQDMCEYEENIAVRMTNTRIEICQILNGDIDSFNGVEFYATGTGASVCVKLLPSYPWITGIDTTMACLLASMGIRIEGVYEHYKPIGKLDFDVELTPEQMDIARYNISVLNAWARNGGRVVG